MAYNTAEKIAYRLEDTIHNRVARRIVYRAVGEDSLYSSRDHRVAQGVVYKVFEGIFSLKNNSLYVDERIIYIKVEKI